ncbi:MAG: hypothetical protein KDD42_06700 [Bdellovibrionales bacterium]|nr:hypothetical protein [Bdellovibrionales bacterium]
MTSKKGNSKKANVAADGHDLDSIKNKAELKDFLTTVRDKMSVNAAPAVHVLAAMQYVFELSNIYDLLDKNNKELARDIWLRLRKAGVQLKSPAILFSAEEVAADVI